MSEVPLFTLRVIGDRGADSKALSQTREPGSASLGLTDYSHVDILGVGHNFVNVEGGEILGSQDRCAQWIETELARGRGRTGISISNRI